MITYFYWFCVVALIFLALFGIGVKFNRWQPAFAVSAVILLVGSILYYFYFQQMFVKRWGGTMTISVPAGQQNIGITWKDDNLWIENFDPKTNTCIFSEYARGNLLQGHVVLKDCNPYPSAIVSTPHTTPAQPQ